MSSKVYLVYEGDRKDMSYGTGMLALIYGSKTEAWSYISKDYIKAFEFARADFELEDGDCELDFEARVAHVFDEYVWMEEFTCQ